MRSKGGGPSKAPPKEENALIHPDVRKDMFSLGLGLDSLDGQICLVDINNILQYYSDMIQSIEYLLPCNLLLEYTIYYCVLLSWCIFFQIPSKNLLYKHIINKLNLVCLLGIASIRFFYDLKFIFIKSTTHSISLQYTL